MNTHVATFVRLSNTLFWPLFSLLLAPSTNTISLFSLGFRMRVVGAVRSSRFVSQCHEVIYIFPHSSGYIRKKRES